MHPWTALGTAGLGATLGPALAGLTVRLGRDQPVLARGWWRGREAGPGRRTVTVGLASATFGGTGLVVGPTVELAAFLWLAGVGVVLAVVDLDCHRLPDRLVLASYPVGLTLLGAAAVTGGDPAQFGRAVACMVAAFGLVLLLAAARPGQLGAGDVKLSGVLGLFLGWLGPAHAAAGLALGFLLGGLAAVFTVHGRGGGRR